MIKLLRGQELPKEFIKARKAAAKVQIAVAYWGRGAVAKLGLHRGAKVDIICNARHEGCNARVVLALVQRGHRVKTNDQLHAKMYLTEKATIIGSSNVSTNGLNEEGSAASVWLEANILSDDPQLVKAAGARFNEYWKASRFIRAPELKRIIKARDARPPRPRFVDTPLLIEACRLEPQLFKNVGILMWSTRLTKEGREIFAKWKKEVKPAHGSDVSLDDIRRSHSFEFEDEVRAGWYFVWKVSEEGEPRYDGLFHIDYFMKREKGLTQYFAIKRREIQLSNGQTIKLTKPDRLFLERHIDRLSDKFYGGVVSLPNAIKFLDGAR